MWYVLAFVAGVLVGGAVTWLYARKALKAMSEGIGRVAG